MNIYRVYGAFLRNVIEVGDSINFLAEPKPEDRIQYVRLEEQKFNLTKEIEYSGNVVTAHKLSQYRKVFTTVRLVDKSSTWLSALLQQDIKTKESLYEIDGA